MGGDLMAREWDVPGYTEVKVLGSGGFGDVVLARHEASGTLVAIKYLHRQLLADATLGVYNEAIMLVRVSFEGESYTFCPFIYVDNDAALACGRELWGFPKKFASMGYARRPVRRSASR